MSKDAHRSNPCGGEVSHHRADGQRPAEYVLAGFRADDLHRAQRLRQSVPAVHSDGGQAHQRACREDTVAELVRGILAVRCFVNWSALPIDQLLDQERGPRGAATVLWIEALSYYDVTMKKRPGGTATRRTANSP